MEIETELHIPTAHLGRDRYSILVAGIEGVGKSSLIERICTNSFPEASQVKLHKAVSKVIRNQNIRADLIEADISEFRPSVHPTTISKAKQFLDLNAVFLIYDCTNRKSFTLIQSEYFIINRKLPPNCDVFLVGCKSDLTPKEVTPQEAETWAESMGISMFETSSKSGTNCDMLIYEVLDGQAERQEATLEYYAEKENQVYGRPLMQEEEERGNIVMSAFCFLPKWWFGR